MKPINILEHGADPGRENNAPAIQAAIEAAHANGGGCVVVPPGRFCSGGIVLRSRVTLHLEAGATLFGAGRLQDYPILNIPWFTDKTRNPLTAALISAEDAEDVALTGPGLIDGNGAADAFRCYPLDDGTGAWHKPQRPWGLRFHRCRRVRIEGVRIEGTAEWAQHYVDCDDLHIRGIRVFNHRNANNDGLDIDGCRNVLIEGCIIDADDDAISLKSTGFQACRDILITNCILASRIRAFHIGSETTGPFANIRVSNCLIRPSAATEAIDPDRSPQGLTAVCIGSMHGSEVENIVVEGLQVEGYATPLALGLSTRQPPHVKYPGIELPLGAIRGFVMRDIVFRRGIGPTASSVVGQVDAPAEDIRLENWDLDLPGGLGGKAADAPVPELRGAVWNGIYGTPLPAHGLYARHVRGLTLRGWNVRLRQPDPRPLFYGEPGTVEARELGQ